MIEHMTIQEYPEGHTIVTQGESGTVFYIIREGKVDFYTDNAKKRSACRFDYFGERSIMFNTERSATLITSEKVVCWQLE